MSKSLTHHTLVLLSTFHVLLFSTTTSFGYPRKKHAYESLPDPPKWFDHCRSAPDLKGVFYNSLHLTTEQQIDNVMRSASFAYKRGKDIKRRFLQEMFKDSEFEISSNVFVELDWLPEIPSASEGTFKEITAENAFIIAHKYMQYYAIGIEQIRLDLSLYKGDLEEEFKDIAEDNYRILCEINIGMQLQKLKPESNVLRNVMNHEYRVIDEMSRRSLRDFIILRDYVNATNFITLLFAYQKSKMSGQE